MKQVVILLIAVLMLAASGPAHAGGENWLGLDGKLLSFEGDLHGVLEFTMLTEYIWRGFDVWAPDTAGIQGSVDLDLYGSGIGISAMFHRAMPAGYEMGERWDYTVYYQNSIYASEPYATNYRIGWVYYNFPQAKASWFDLHELQMILAWPNILPVKGLCPSYAAVGLWPMYENNLFTGDAAGWAHIFMLDYGWTLTGILPEVPEQVVNFHGELVYNDGVDPRGIGVDHDWSNWVIGASTDFDCGYNVTLTPALYYQRTMDKSVNLSPDETWFTLSAKYTF
ncbi:MAG: hypothetical protein JSU70_21735 [Phycisphaerales bacterium]|nr:MAG: hypothetical protein JSU70_21735 [Phycisphaerales bacterium]